MPKARARVTRRGTFTPKTTESYARLVAMCARTAGVRMLAGKVWVSMCFYLPTERRADIDNLAKAVMDALNGIAWVDDSQITMLFASKYLDRANPRAVVSIEAEK